MKVNFDMTQQSQMQRTTLMNRTTQPEQFAAGDRPAACCQGADAGAVRCCCGSLVAKRVTGGVELKCRRCKRTIVLTLTTAEEVRAGD